MAFGISMLAGGRYSLSLYPLAALSTQFERDKETIDGVRG